MTLDQYGHLFPDDLDDVADKMDDLVSGLPKMCPQRKQVRAKIRSDLPLSLVELPGIEPAAKIVLTCSNLRIGYGKRSQSTRKHLRVRGGC